jgi:hypothetical protein
MNEDVDILPYKRFNEKTTFNKKDYSESFDLSIAFNMLFNQNNEILVKRNQHSQEFGSIGHFCKAKFRNINSTKEKFLIYGEILIIFLV